MSKLQTTLSPQPHVLGHQSTQFVFSPALPLDHSAGLTEGGQVLHSILFCSNSLPFHLSICTSPDVTGSAPVLSPPGSSSGLLGGRGLSILSSQDTSLDHIQVSFPLCSIHGLISSLYPNLELSEDRVTTRPVHFDFPHPHPRGCNKVREAKS